MKSFFRLGLILATAAPLLAAELPQKFDGATPLEWSQRLADSEMKRLGNSLEFGGTVSSRAGGSNPKAR